MNHLQHIHLSDPGTTCVDRVQHIERSSHATCCVMRHVVRKDRSGTVGQSLNCIYLSFTLLAEPLSDDSVTPREAAVSRETHAERFDVIQHRTLSLHVATAQVSSPYVSTPACGTPCRRTDFSVF